MTQTPPQQHAQAKPRPRHRWLGRLVWSLGVVCVVFGLALAGLGYAVGRDIVVPDWAGQEVEARLNRNSAGLGLRVGEIVVRVEQGWQPRLLLRDVDVARPDGRPLISLSRVEAGLSMAALMRGKLQPDSVRLAGAGLRLRRLRDGSFNIDFGQGLLLAGQGATLVQLTQRLDDLLQRPEFSALQLVEAEALTLRYEDMRLSRGWTVDGGRLRLVRSGDDLGLSADLALLGGGDTVTTLEMNYDSVVGQVAAQFGVNIADMAAQDIAVHSPALAWLNVLRAPISGAMRVAVDEAGQLGPLSAALQVGSGVLQPTDETTPIPFDSLRAYMTYEPQAQTLTFDDLSVVSPWASLRAEGVAVMQGLDLGWPTEFIGQFSLSDIRANPDGLYEDPVVLEGADADVRLRLDPFDLQVGRLTVRDRGQALQLAGRLQATPEGWALGLRGAMDAVARARVLDLWPVRALPRTREWIADNIHAAALRDIELAYRSAPGSDPDLYLAAGFQDAEIGFLKGFPHITKAAGQASLRNARFVVSSHAGKIVAPQGGEVDVGGTTVVIPDVRIRETPARVRLRSRSSITAALSLLDLAPFGFLTKAGQPVTLATGQAEAEGTIDLILKRGLQTDEIGLSVQASLRDLRSEQIIPGRVLSAPQLSVDATTERLRISGAGMLGQVPFDAVWETGLGKDASGSRVSGTVELSQGFADEFDITLPPGSLSGRAPATIELDLPPEKAPQFALRSSLQGLGLSLPPLGWSLPQAGSGTFEVSGQLGSPPVIDRLSLEAPGLSAQGSITLRADGQLAEARFGRVRAGGWLDAPVLLTGRGAGAAPAITVSSGTVDLRRTTIGAGGGGGSSGGGPVTLALERLQISDGIALTGFRGDFATARGFDGSFAARVNGLAPITGRIVPRDGRSAFRILSQDAGAVLSAAGLFRQARQGDLDLTLLPAARAGEYDGLLTVRQVRMQDAPALAELLSAVSVIGLLEQLDGQGIAFSEVDADFRLTPDRVIVKSASATGASLGISMDGTYDMANDLMDMQGVFSPIYMVNSIGSVLTRKGEGLLGFSYTISGSADAPRVQVNPLSIFTPGMFREIFRRPPPQVTQ